MKILVTGVTGYVGAVLVPALLRDGHQVRGFAREPRRANLSIEIVQGDALSAQALGRALQDIEVAYYLIHSMDARSASDGRFAETERASAERFARAAADRGVRRIVYLGGILPASGAASAHLASRVAVERTLLEAVPDSVAFRASIVIGAGSRSFRFLVRLVERLPVMAMPAWNTNRTQPIDERDIVAILAKAATSAGLGGMSLDVAGPDVVTYGELIARIQELMMVDRPTVSFKRLMVTPIASRLGAVIAGEQHELIGPLMESLDTDLLPRDQRASELLNVRLHRLDAAIERALREWEASEPLAAR